MVGERVDSILKIDNNLMALKSVLTLLGEAWNRSVAVGPSEKMDFWVLSGSIYGFVLWAAGLV